MPVQVHGSCIPALALAGSFFAAVAGAEGAQPSNRPIEVRSDGYVSSRTCRSCHPANYASWFA